jgi:proteasome lid subunit RPN8/RPN11
MNVVPNPGGSSPVTLSVAAAAAIRAAAEAAAPQEACGLLFGTATDTVTEIAEATVAPNVAAEPLRYFEIDPAHLFDAHRRARAGPLALVGCWHSHPHRAAFPSRRDVEGITDRSWLWLIVAGGDIAGFRPDAEGFQPIALLEAAL